MLLSVGSPLHILGLCTGLLPAAAALISSNVTDLFTYGLEMVAMSIRMAHELSVRSEMVDETPGSWAYSLVGATASEIEQTLKSFHKAQVRDLRYHATSITDIIRQYHRTSKPTLP